MELRRGVAGAAEASYDLAGRIRAAGNITALDLANERAQYEQSKLDLARAEAAAADTRERLNVLLGLWGQDTAWTATDRLADPPEQEVPTDAVERRAVERSVELAAAGSQVEAAARALGVQRSLALLPEAQAGVAAEHEPDGAWAVGPAVSLPIPLLDQGQARTAAARAQLRRARRQYFATAVEVRSAARVARGRLLAARDRAVYLRRVMLPLRQEITSQTQLQYNAMLVGPLQLLQARRAEIEAGVEYVDALREYWVARSQVEQVESGRTSGIVPVSSAAAGTTAPSRSAGGH
jgi:cobalt-zinc-cadmium efflux system outer membrane protein